MPQFDSGECVLFAKERGTRGAWDNQFVVPDLERICPQ